MVDLAMIPYVMKQKIVSVWEAAVMCAMKVKYRHVFPARWPVKVYQFAKVDTPVFEDEAHLGWLGPDEKYLYTVHHYLMRKIRQAEKIIPTIKDKENIREANVTMNCHIDMANLARNVLSLRILAKYPLPSGHQMVIRKDYEVVLAKNTTPASLEDYYRLGLAKICDYWL